MFKTVKLQIEFSVLTKVNAGKNRLLKNYKNPVILQFEFFFLQK